MASRTQYVCQQCGYSQVGWAGKCPNCGSWNSLVETVTNNKRLITSSKKSSSLAKPISLSSIPSKKTSRISTKINELDRVLGGGIVYGQVILIAGEPGIGKSTLLLQLADKIGDVLYVCGEESSGQIKVRAERLGIKKADISLLEETDVDTIINSLSGLSNVKTIVVDSIQTLTTSDLSGMAGSVGQVRECAFRLTNLAKKENIPLFIVGHVTKEGTVAGPAVLAHIVDCILWFEGEKSLTLRILRAVKNRFGPTDEVGIFSMEEKGLNPIGSPEKLFLTSQKKAVAGSAVTSILEGTRPILVEIQSLVIPSKLAFPRRIAQGISSGRLELLLAVLIRRLGLPLYEYDVFINVAGGISVVEPGADLAICLSVASSFFDKVLPKNLIAVGEVGLLGEIREVVSQEKRIKEAKRLGYTTVATSDQFKYASQAVKRFLR